MWITTHQSIIGICCVNHNPPINYKYFLYETIHESSTGICCVNHNPPINYKYLLFTVWIAIHQSICGICCVGHNPPINYRYLLREVQSTNQLRAFASGYPDLATVRCSYSPSNWQLITLKSVSLVRKHENTLALPQTHHSNDTFACWPIDRWDHRYIHC